MCILPGTGDLWELPEDLGVCLEEGPEVIAVVWMVQDTTAEKHRLGAARFLQSGSRPSPPAPCPPARLLVAAFS